MNNQHLYGLPKFIGLTIAIFLLVACAAPPSPLPQGRILLYSTGNIFEVPTDSPVGKATDVRIAGPGIMQQYIIFWPEKNYLAYRTVDDVRLLNLDSREVKTFSTGPTTCMSWSLDLSYMTYISTESDENNLYLYDTASGASTLVYAAPAATYSDGRTHSGSITCGAWIGVDRFVFDRTVGMPSQLTSVNGVTEGVPANTTTLAIIGETISLVDSPEMLSIYGISEDGKHLIFGMDESGMTNLYHVSPPPSFDNFEFLSPRLIASQIFYNSFTMMGNEVAYDDYEDKETRIRIVNLDTFQEREGPTITGLYGWVWAGSFEYNVIAFPDDAGNLRLVDMKTDTSKLVASDALVKDMELLGLEEGASYSAYHLIGWLPSK